MTFKVDVLELKKSLKKLSTVHSYNLRSNSVNTIVNVLKSSIVFEVNSPEFSLQEVVKIQNSNKINSRFELDITILGDFLSAIVGETIDISVKNNSLKLSLGDRKFEQKIHKTNTELRLRSINNRGSIYPIEFLQKIKGLCFAITPQAYSAALNSLYLKRVSKGYEAIATNGYILSRDKIDNVSFNSEELLIPKNAVECASKIFSDKQINIHDSLDVIHLSHLGSFFYIRSVDLNYIDIKNILPKGYKHRIKISKSIVYEFVNLLNKLTKSELSIVEFEICTGVCTIRCKRSSKISMEQSFEVESMVELAVSFNGKLLSDVLSNIEGDLLDFSFNNAISPFSLKSSSELSNKESIILPIRL